MNSPAETQKPQKRTDSLRERLFAPGSAPEEMYRSIFENAIEGISQTTPTGQYLNVNPALAKMCGYDSAKDLVAGLTAIDSQLYVNGKRRTDFVQLMKEQGFVRSFESEIYKKDGSIIWISENARAVRDADGKLTYYEGMAENLSRPVRLEALRDMLARWVPEGSRKH